ncbi:transcriptional Coactivator p15-domain-containing protein [Mycena alexandri]|uniref:Transcriptional Coactivator p15-domain-containing protein n=1 Tax=Mycena alexandri TaxID=1745969 RepID=A0AAD6XEP8_9AGAR|nr:transcriptional Coactivator p15-domain-containing protein [Mycena alexandri]
MQKSKLEATKAEHDEVESEQEAPVTVKKPAKYKQKVEEFGDDSKVQTSSDGEKFIELGKAKRATVRNFKGSTLIDIREFYTDKETGEPKPGKKGISLTPEQWQELKQATPTLDALIAKISKK